MSLDESCDVHDTPQLLISLSGIAKEFEIMEELAAMRWMKACMTVQAKC